MKPYCGVYGGARGGRGLVGSFVISDNTCPICRAGYQSRCIHGKFVAQTIGNQAQFARIPLADGTLVATPDVPSDDLIPSLLAASDVLGTGWFGADAAEVGPGKTVVVVGDGAVGLCGVLAAKQMGAERIIAITLLVLTLQVPKIGQGPRSADWRRIWPGS